MGKFTFNGEWKLDLNLIEISKLNSDRFYKYEIRQSHKEKLLNEKVPVTIYDEHTENPDPIPEQISAIDWIVDNQNEILKTVFNDLINIVWPHYIKIWKNDSENEYSYPKISNYQELDKALGIDSIGIHCDKADGISYYSMFFSFCTDEEHGLALIYHKNRLIDFGGIGDVDNKKILEDQGISFDDWFDIRMKLKEKKILKLYTPHPKYGKLKPWQESDNKYFPFGLLHANRIEDLISYLKSNNDLAKQIIPDLIKIAEHKNKNELITKLKTMANTL